MKRPFVLALFAVGLVAVLAIAPPTVAVPGASLSYLTVQGLAGRTMVNYFDGRVPVQMAVRIAYIESSFNPTAVRIEAARGDASVGLMQTLVSTARWLATDMGYTAYGVPSFGDLLKPDVSMYFGMAYLDWLANRNPSTEGRSEETIVRAYNGGPGGAASAATLPYWQKYLAAAEVVG